MSNTRRVFYNWLSWTWWTWGHYFMARFCEWDGKGERVCVFVLPYCVAQQGNNLPSSGIVTLSQRHHGSSTSRKVYFSLQLFFYMSINRWSLSIFRVGSSWKKRPIGTNKKAYTLNSACNSTFPFDPARLPISLPFYSLPSGWNWERLFYSHKRNKVLAGVIIVREGNAKVKEVWL